MMRFVYMPRLPVTKPVHKDAKGIRADWNRALRVLNYELSRIGASDVTIGCGYKRFRNDGAPYADDRAEHGHARVSFVKNGVPMTFSYGGWLDFNQNLYMIALTLERLRAVDRYGCTQDGQQYAGFSALPPGRSAIQVSEWPSAQAAMRFLCLTAGMVEGDDTSEAMLTKVFPAAARRSHPDYEFGGGSTELMAKVNRARDFIRSTR